MSWQKRVAMRAFAATGELARASIAEEKEDWVKGGGS